MSIVKLAQENNEVGNRMPLTMLSGAMGGGLGLALGHEYDSVRKLKKGVSGSIRGKLTGGLLGAGLLGATAYYGMKREDDLLRNNKGAIPIRGW